MGRSYTHIFASPGSRLTGTKGGTYMFAGPGWTGTTPAGIDKVFQAETDFVGTLTRTGINGAADIPKVREIQRGYRFTPLSAYMAEKPPHPRQNWIFLSGTRNRQRALPLSDT
jgi:Uncharacterized conserved protein